MHVKITITCWVKKKEPISKIHFEIKVLSNDQYSVEKRRPIQNERQVDLFRSIYIFFLKREKCYCMIFLNQNKKNLDIGTFLIKLEQ